MRPELISSGKAPKISTYHGIGYASMRPELISSGKEADITQQVRDYLGFNEAGADQLR